jgi:hypothetical protein
MLNIRTRAAVFFAVLTLAACAHAPVRVDEMKDRSVGLIYGQLQMPSEDWNMLELVMIQRVGKVYGGMGLRGLGERIHVTPDGRYVAENIVPGKYMLAGFVIGSDRNFMGKSALNHTVEVKAGGIHYLGTYTYVPKKGSSIISPGTFELAGDQSKKAHARLLLWLEEATRETRWHAGVKKRLADMQVSVPEKK